MDRLPYIDLPQSTFNTSSTSRFDVPAVSVSTANNTFERGYLVQLMQGAGAISFVASSAGGGETITIPSSTQIGDLIAIVVQTQTARPPADFSVIFNPNERIAGFVKFAENGDPGRSLVVGLLADPIDSYVSVAVVYRNVASYTTQSASSVSATLIDFSATQAQQAYANLYFALGDKGTVALNNTSTWTPSGATTRQTAQGSQNAADGNDTIFAGDAFSTETIIPGGTETNIGGNPLSGFTRLRAKHDGTFQVRNSAGAETKVGGTVSVVSRVLSAAQAHAGGTTNVSGLSISIPAGKTATIILCAPIRETQTSTAGQYLRNVIINNPAGASGSVVGTFFAKAIDGTDATAGAIADGDVFSVAANASVTLSVSSGTTSGDVVQGWSEVITLSNTSTTTAATVTPSITSGASQQSTVPIGSSIFAIIT